MLKDKDSEYRSIRMNNEDGIVIVAALMVMVMLTIIGFLANKVSQTEVQIATQEVIYQQNFYQAEGATMEAVGDLESVPDPVNAPPDWLITTVGTITDEEVRDRNFWDGDGGGDISPESSSMDHTNYIAASEGPVTGTSLDMVSSKVYSYSVYGRCAPPNRGATVVQVGYLVAY